MNDRLVALIDMDCFYCQVEARLNPTLKGKPVAVVQYNQWKGGGIIAVNYEARDRGVTRHMRGEEAKKHCPEIQLVSVPAVRGKADLTKYRDAGREVIKVICEFSDCVQRASVDEAYVDLTDAVEKRLVNKVKISKTQLENTFVVGYSREDNDEVERERGVETWLQDVYSSELIDPLLHRLATATALVEEMRSAVFDRTGFRCSAGISHNKILAKLVCGLHKPNRQTVLPMSSIAELYRNLPIKKVRNLGGKFGNDVVETLGITYMGELANFTEKQLQTKYDEKTGTWLYNIARGVDLDPVTPRLVSKSIGCCKNFPGKTSLDTKDKVTHWLSELVAEMAERLDEDIQMNKRKAQLLTIHFSQEINGKDVSMSRSVALPSYDADKIVNCALIVLSRHNQSLPSEDVWHPALKYLGLSAGKFVEYSGNSKNSIDKFFKNVSSTVTSKENTDVTYEERSVVTNKNPAAETSNGVNTINCPIEETAPVPTISYSNNKPSGRVSFFERYFKNQPNKIIINNLPTENIQIENHNCPQNYGHENQLSEFHQKINNEYLFNNKACENNNDASQEHLMSSETTNESDNTWISPSEIFPDFENIDDSIMEILPSPLQKKILIMKTLKSNCAHPENKQQFSDSSRESTGSDCATVVETFADIHASSTEQHSAGTAFYSVIKETDENSTEEEEHMIEPEGQFDTTCINVFELEAEENKKLQVQCEVCSYCKKPISVYELPEHLDHHVAMELHEQLNKPQQIPRTTNSNLLRTDKMLPVISDKKKRGRPSKKDALPAKKSKTILSFFTKN